MNYRFFHSIAMGFRPIFFFLAILLAICQCSEKCYPFWPCEMVPHIEIREIETYDKIPEEC